MHILEAEEKVKQHYSLPRSSQDIMLWKMQYGDCKDFQRLFYNTFENIQVFKDLYRNWVYNTLDRFPQYFTWSVRSYNSKEKKLTVTLYLSGIQVCVANVDKAVKYFTGLATYNPEGNFSE